MSDDFEWHGPEATAVVVRHQPAIAVYRNVDDDVVVRQRGDYPDEDQFVIVSMDCLPTLIAALQREITPAPPQRRLPAPSASPDPAPAPAGDLFGGR